MNAVINTRLKALAIAGTLLLPTLAFAGGSAEFEAGSGSDRAQVRFEFDRQLLRMTPMKVAGNQNEGEFYSVFRDGKMYSVVSNDGQPMVVEVGAMLKMMGKMMANQPTVSDGLDDIAEFHGLKATGRSETHAGVTGEVHTLEYTTSAGKRESKELVLAENSTLFEMGNAMSQFSQSMAASMGQPVDTPGSKAIEAELSSRKLGVLRVGDDFRLVRLDKTTPAAARFALPAEPMQMPEMPAGLQQMLGGGAAGAGATGLDGSNVEGAVQDRIARQKERAEQRANEEVDSATDQVVDKALDKAFNKLFGR